MIYGFQQLSSCIHEMNEKNLDFIYHNMRVKKLILFLIKMLDILGI